MRGTRRKGSLPHRARCGLPRFFYQTIGLGAYGPLLVEEHTAIAQALREGDPQKARHAMERHIQNTKERTSQLFLR